MRFMKGVRELMSSEMWLTYDSNQKKLRFPVLPEKIDIAYGSKDDSVYIQDKGEVVLSMKPAATQIKFSSYFPAKACQGSVEKPIKPKKALAFLKAVQKLDGCARFVYTGGAIPIAMNCRIAFTAKEEGGDVGTIHYTITIKEYKEIKVRKIKVKVNDSATVANLSETKVAQPKSETKGRASTKPKEETYTVKTSDENLYTIMKKVGVDVDKVMDVYNANKPTFREKGPYFTYPGQTLKIVQ